jgi:hypothetical protein
MLPRTASTAPSHHDAEASRGAAEMPVVFENSASFAGERLAMRTS